MIETEIVEQEYKSHYCGYAPVFYLCRSEKMYETIVYRSEKM